MRPTFLFLNMVLLQQFLPAICRISVEFIFQLDSAATHRALEAIIFVAHNDLGLLEVYC